MDKLGGLLNGNLNADVKVNVVFDLLSTMFMGLVLLIAVVMGNVLVKMLG